MIDSRSARDHFESADAYLPDDELLSAALSAVGWDWTLRRSGVWFELSPRNAPSLPPQGWTIRVSATVDGARSVLVRAAQVCAASNRAFRFALDRPTLARLNSKSDRGDGAGELMAIYPLDSEDLKDLLQKLHEVLKDDHGPQVPGGRRYRDCQVLYYRYGGMPAASRLSPNGQRTPVLVSPSGMESPDVWQPHFSLPEWVIDPFPEESAADGDRCLASGRYTVERTLATSNAGAVYVARTPAGLEVVIKKACPHAWTERDGSSAQTILEKEFRILGHLGGTGIAPEPIELFEERGNLFLAQEMIRGTTLRAYLETQSYLLSTRRTSGGTRANRERLTRLWASLARALATLHARGITFGDVAPGNVVITDTDRMALRLIDFGGAIETEVDAQRLFSTPGFSGPNRTASATDDLYSLGALMLASMWPLHSLVRLQPDDPRRIVHILARDAGIPRRHAELVSALLDSDPGARPDAGSALEALERPVDGRPPRRPATVDLAAVIRGIHSYNVAASTPERDDRLFPANPNVFRTNPLSVAHGACGVARAFALTGQAMPAFVLPWILSRPISDEVYSPGLYQGIAGIAWCLLELGRPELGRSLLDKALDHSLLRSSPGLWQGMAGVGLATLRFWRAGGESRLIDAAVGIGDELLRTAVRARSGCHWVDWDGVRPIGYGLGASGIATFLVYLHAATREPAYLDAARQALAYDLASAVRTGDGHISFRTTTDVRSPMLPLLGWGSAGVGTAILRYLAVTDDAELRSHLDDLIPDVTRKYVFYPGLWDGLAGMANFLLDCHQFLGDARLLGEARKVVDGIMLYRVRRSAGIAFPGEGLAKLSSEYASGSAGIALVLDRLRRAELGQPAPNFNFMLDELLEVTRD